MNFLTAYRERWKSQTRDASLPLGFERLPLFSSAAPAQETTNLSRMWRRWANTWVPWQFGSWINEAMAVHQTAFLGDWSALTRLKIVGTSAAAFIESIAVADLNFLKPGKVRHLVCCNENGKVASEGVLGRISANEFFFSGGGGEWIAYHASLVDADVSVEIVTPDEFIFQVQGPTSKDIINAVSEINVDNLEFGHWVTSSVQGTPVRIVRVGVSGELGYELHGSVADGAMIWAELASKGAAHGIVEIGARSQVVTHVEAGIATVGFDYVPATVGSAVVSATSVIGGGQKVVGSHKFERMEDLFRSPLGFVDKG